MNTFKKIILGVNVVTTVEGLRRAAKLIKLTEAERDALVDRAQAVVDQYMDAVVEDLGIERTFTVDVDSTMFTLSANPINEYMVRGLTTPDGLQVGIFAEAIYLNLLPGQSFEKAVVNVLAHELRHVYQFQSGEDVMDGYLRLPILYDFNKYEIDARKYARHFVKRFYK